MKIFITKNFQAQFSNRIFFVAGVIVLCIFAGIVTGLGKLTYVVPVIAIMSIPLVARLSIQTRFRILLATPILILAQMPRLHIPLSTPPVALILLLLSVTQLLLTFSKRGFYLPANGLEFIPLLIFTLGGLLTALITNNIGTWHTAGLIPLLLFILGANLVRDQKDVWQIIRMSFVAIAGYILIVGLANATGHVTNMNNMGADWRWIGLGQIIQLGPIQYSLWSVTFGVLAGLGCPIAVALLLREKTFSLSRLFYGLSLISFFIILGFTAARGATIAMVVSSLLVIAVWARHRPITTLSFIALAGLILYLNQNALLNLLPPSGVERFLELWGGGSGLLRVTTLDYRLQQVYISLNNINDHPLGLGYSYMWYRYGFDEAILYSALLNGTGIIGALGYSLVMLQFLWRFLQFFNNAQTNHEYALLIALGLGVWVYGFLSGFSSESLLLSPVHSFLFWVILITTYYGIRLPVSLESKRKGKSADSGTQSGAVILRK